jgi:diguanylate cyclase (GGDEF)-like protein/putative nucleotidyltransferase with HDIG domain
VDEAITDGLTGLKTHFYFMEALDKERRRSTLMGRQFSLIMMDLDRFKQVDDRLGRAEADKVLSAVGALLDARSRQPNVVARYGGDEFAILMPEADAQQAGILAEELRAAMEADGFLSAREVTGSFGIATFPERGGTQEEILRVADLGIGLARHCGGNCVKAASQNPKPEDAERDKRLLEACLGVAAQQVPSSAPDAAGNDRHKCEQINSLLDTISALAFAVEAKGPYMRDHSQAVSRLAAQIAIQAGLSRAEIEAIRVAGMVHDMGKLHVPEQVLQKPTPLTEDEFEVMKTHAAWGAEMLGPLKVEDIERIVRHHHERYDGTGYPDGLAGDGIPLGARIVAVAESFHNMLSDLRYKSARSFQDALEELRRCSGTQFDPKIVIAFLEWLQTHAAPKV